MRPSSIRYSVQTAEFISDGIANPDFGRQVAIQALGRHPSQFFVTRARLSRNANESHQENRSAGPALCEPGEFYPGPCRTEPGRPIAPLGLGPQTVMQNTV